MRSHFIGKLTAVALPVVLILGAGTTSAAAEELASTLHSNADFRMGDGYCGSDGDGAIHTPRQLQRDLLTQDPWAQDASSASPSDLVYTVSGSVTGNGGPGYAALCGWLTEDAAGTPTSPNCRTFGGRDGRGQIEYASGAVVRLLDVEWGEVVYAPGFQTDTWTFAAVGRYERLIEGSVHDSGAVNLLITFTSGCSYYAGGNQSGGAGSAMLTAHFARA